MIKHFLGGAKLSWRLTHPGEWLIDLCRETRAVIQRGFRGYADSDTCGLDYYLQEIIPKMVRRIIKDKTGYPTDITEESWDKILEKIARGFEANRKLMDLEWESVEDEQRLRDKWVEGSELFIKYFNYLWD